MFNGLVSTEQVNFILVFFEMCIRDSSKIAFPITVKAFYFFHRVFPIVKSLHDLINSASHFPFLSVFFHIQKEQTFFGYYYEKRELFHYSPILFAMHIPVSYTHLDVYKRQELRFRHISPSPAVKCA